MEEVGERCVLKIKWKVEKDNGREQAEIKQMHVPPHCAMSPHHPCIAELETCTLLLNI